MVSTVGTEAPSTAAIIRNDSINFKEIDTLFLTSDVKGYAKPHTTNAGVYLEVIFPS